LSTKKIVIAGGPSTGKTSVVSGIESNGFTCFHEISREITLQARKEGIEQLFLTDPLLFSERILQGRVTQFKEAEAHENPLVFLDRGLPDVVAYLDCFGTPYPETFTTVCAEHKYDAIFLLPPWKEIHTADNERYENFEEAVRIHDCLEKAYQSFGYHIIDVPKLSIDDRVNFILDTLKLN
tara:strand:+ start:92751 stop:93293 length:543 start_codon:yes stop_codon:yes gene_type:complete